jgi:hypothetical protein
MPGASSVYAIGCETWQAQPWNLVNDPGFEASELPLTPGRAARWYYSVALL